MSLNCGGEVLGPVVGEDLGELVEAEQDRRDGEGDPQQQERLGGGIAAQRLALGHRDRTQVPGDGGAH